MLLDPQNYPDPSWCVHHCSLISLTPFTLDNLILFCFVFWQNNRIKLPSDVVSFVYFESGKNSKTPLEHELQMLCVTLLCQTKKKSNSSADLSDF